jgi:ABC-type glycerol-3-phosphate transport system substrate-binding protein
MQRSLWRILAALFAFSLIAAACAGDDDDDTAADDGTEDDGGDAGDDGAEDVELDVVDVFQLPPVGDSGDVLLTAGTFVGAFENSDEVMQVLEYMASPEYVEARLEAGVGGFLSANQNADINAYSGFEQTLVEILQGSEVARFDGSDNMVAEVGAGTFWTAATDIVSGQATVEEAFARVEENYPEVVTGTPDCPAPEQVEGDGTVTLFGPEVEQELAGNQQAFDQFTEETGIEVQVQGDRSAEEQVGVQVEGGNPPDIFIFPQPGLLRRFAYDCELVPLPDNVVAAAEENFNEGFLEGGTVGDVLYGVPNKSDVKSLVWYSPPAFEANGYEIPTTHEELIALSDQMVADGEAAPWCIGIGSDAATGWPFTDWMEDYMLRLNGPEVYDQWVFHEIPFDDPEVVEVGNFVMDIWSEDGYVFGGLQAAASTPFADAGLGVIEGDCFMHRQANFYAAQWPEGVQVGTEG